MPVDPSARKTPPSSRLCLTQRPTDTKEPGSSWEMQAQAALRESANCPPRRAAGLFRKPHEYGAGVHRVSHERPCQHEHEGGDDDPRRARAHGHGP